LNFAVNRVFGKVAAAVRELGLGSAVLYVVDRCCQRLGRNLRLHRYEFVAQPVLPTPLLGGRRGQSITVRLVGADDTALLQMPLTRDVIARRAAQGAVCFGAGRASWDFDVYLRPDQRLGPGFARLWDTANAYLRERGVRWSVSRISAFNPRSLAAHARLGTRRIGSAIFLCLGRLQVALSSIPPHIHFSHGPSRVPVFRLDASPAAQELPVADAAQARKI
jgi:hypothetical protein